MEFLLASSTSVVNALVRHRKRGGGKLINSNNIGETFIKAFVMTIVIETSTEAENLSGSLIITIISKKSRKLHRMVATPWGRCIPSTTHC